jgi:hypothetical protein
MTSAERLSEWCAVVEAAHAMEYSTGYGELRCMECLCTWPCHAIQGARVVRAAMSVLHGWPAGRAQDLREAMAAALEAKP